MMYPLRNPPVVSGARTDSKTRNRILWDSIPYTPGYVEAVAYSYGSPKPVARHRIETAGKPVKLQHAMEGRRKGPAAHTCRGP